MRLFSVSIHALCLFMMLSAAYAQLPPSMSFWVADEIASGACNANPVHLYGQSTQYTLNGTMMMARPMKKDGTYDDENKFALYVQSVIEQRATVETLNPPRACLTDSPIIKTLDLKNCSCSSAPYLREGPGFKDAGQVLNFYGCGGQKNFTFSLYMAIPNTTHAEVYNTTVLGSTLDNFTYTSPGGGLKLGMEMKDWSWDEPSESSGIETFLGITYQMWSHSPIGGLLNFSQSATALVFSLNLAGYPFDINMDKGLIFDGQPSIVGGSRSSYIVPIPPLQSLWYAFEFNQGFCTSTLYPLTHPQNISYDPSIVSLFSNDPTLGPRSKSSKTVGIAVGVTIGAIVLIVVVIVVLVLTVPAVRQIVRPFSKPRGELLNPMVEPSSPSQGNDWTAASKPTSH